MNSVVRTVTSSSSRLLNTHTTRLSLLSNRLFSTNHSIDQRSALTAHLIVNVPRHTHRTKELTVSYSEQQPRLRIKTSQEWISEVPPIEVDGPIAVCDGGDDSLGHPIEYIQLNKVHLDQPETCKYCGLRFIQKHHEHH